MPTAARCIISAIGMLLKMNFRGCQLKQKMSPFLFNANGFYKMEAEKNLNKVSSGTSLKEILSIDIA